MTRSKTKNRKRSHSFALARRSLREVLYESDSTYLLKLVLYILLATVWLKFGQPIKIGALSIQAIPFGLLAGLLIVRLAEARQLERKIMYAMVLTIGILTYFVPAGIVL